MRMPSAVDRMKQSGRADDSGTRRTEILQTAASLIASSGLRTSLQEIADAADVPIGTVMSRLARARGKLARSLQERIAKER